MARHSSSRASSPARSRSAGSMRKYVDPSLQELNGFLFDASLIYSMSALTKVKLIATTVASETTVPGTSGVLTRNAGIEVEHSFRRWLIGAVKFNYGLDDYVGSARKDDRYSVSARAHLQAQPHGAGQGRGPAGMVALDRAGRRLRGLGVPARHASCSMLDPQAFQLRGTPARCRGARARRRHWRKGIRASSRSRRCGPRTGSA